jgi:hypothetical protein
MTSVVLSLRTEEKTKKTHLKQHFTIYLHCYNNNVRAIFVEALVLWLQTSAEN